MRNLAGDLKMKAKYLVPIMIILMSAALLISPYFFLLLIALVVES